MERDLTGFGARIIHIQDPLVMAFTTGAGGAGDSRGMKSMAFEHGATQQVIQRRKLGEQFASRLFRASCAWHLYRCYTLINVCQYISWKKCLARKHSAAALDPLHLRTGCVRQQESVNPFDP